MPNFTGPGVCDAGGEQGYRPLETLRRDGFAPGGRSYGVWYIRFRREFLAPGAEAMECDISDLGGICLPKVAEAMGCDKSDLGGIFSTRWQKLWSVIYQI